MSVNGAERGAEWTVEPRNGLEHLRCVKLQIDNVELLAVQTDRQTDRHSRSAAVILVTERHTMSYQTE